MLLENAIPVYSYTWLCDKMADRGRVAIRYNLNGNTATMRGIINGIRPEDGSGNHWLVTVHDNGTNAEVYVRTA
jgi:hypothetical protein